MECRICKNQQGNKLYRVRDMHFGNNGVFDYIECTQCGCLQISEVPANLQDYYPQDYYAHVRVRSPVLGQLKKFVTKERDYYTYYGHSVLGYLADSLLKSASTEIIRCIRKTGVNSGSKILDVGCGQGSLLLRLNEIGFTSLTGVDPFIACDTDYGNGVKIHKKHIQDIAGEFDLVMFNHSFEHIPDQESTLRHVSKILSPDGICMIRIPTVTSLPWGVYRENWVQIDAPRHIYLHSIESIRLLASRFNLTLSNYFYDSHALQFLGSEQYCQSIPLVNDRSFLVNPKHSIFGKKEIESFEAMSRLLNKYNLGDQVVLFFTRPDAQALATAQPVEAACNA